MVSLFSQALKNGLLDRFGWVDRSNCPVLVLNYEVLADASTGKWNQKSAWSKPKN
jgi:hypothetical protein